MKYKLSCLSYIACKYVCNLIRIRLWKKFSSVFLNFQILFLGIQQQQKLPSPNFSQKFKNFTFQILLTITLVIFASQETLSTHFKADYINFHMNGLSADIDSLWEHINKKTKFSVLWEIGQNLQLRALVNNKSQIIS